MKNLPVARLLLTGSLALAGIATDAAAAPAGRPPCEDQATRAECLQHAEAKRREDEFLRNKPEALKSIKGIEEPGLKDANDLGLKDADSPGFTLKEAPVAENKPAQASKPRPKVVQRRPTHGSTASGVKHKTHSQQEQ